MGQGNPNKVNAIVDEIVKNNSVFKLKSPIEQDKEKDSMARSINSALSVLNEVGKELVLQDLSVDPDEKFKGFIDSVGNIDISGLTKMTVTIVKAKIEEADREGLNLRTGEPVFTSDNKISLVEGVLTVAVIDTMIRDFDKLSSKDRNVLANNWLSMTNDQKFAYRDALGRMLHQKSNIIDDSKTREELEQLGQEAQKGKSRYELALSSFNTLENDKQIKWIEEILGRKLLPEEINNKSLKDLFEDAFFRRLDKQNKAETHLADQLERLENSKGNPDITQNVPEVLESGIKEDINKVIDAKELNDYIMLIPPEERPIPLDEFKKLSESEKKKVLASLIPDYMSSRETTKTNIISKKNKISQEIKQLPIALAKAGFSLENITEAMTMYREMIQSIPPEEYDGMDTSAKIIEFFKSGMEPPKNKADEILLLIAQNEFGGQLQQILTNPQLLQETFLPALSAEIEKLEQQPIPDEHTDEYYRSQATTLTLDRNVEEIAKKVQAQGGSVKEITVALAKKIEERATEQSQHSIPEEESKEQKTEQPTPPIFENPTSPEEPTPESATSPEQETLEETGQNMAMVKQDNSFIGKIRRVFANMKDMKNKDNSKGFFARLGASIKTVFGNKEEHYEEQDSTSTAPTPEIQSQSTARREPINYITQHFEVNESIARKETEKSKKAKDFSNADDRTTDEEEK